MKKPGKDHPIWKTLHVLALGAVLWFNASNFDETELKAIGQWVLIGLGVEKARSSMKD